MTVKKCTLCDCTLTDFNVTKEHIIPNAIGGRKKVIGFICLTCNSESGSGWDGELTKEIEPLSLLLGISRQRGNVPPQEFSTAGGERVQVKVDGTWTIGEPRVTESRDGNITRIHIRARDKSDYLRILKGLRKKYPQLRDRDDLMASYRESSYYSDDPIGIELPYFLGVQAERSLVKSALALTFDAGVDPRQGDLALDYLGNESVEACFGYYYERGNDLVVNRPGKLPFHCVYVAGSSSDSTLLGYVELYGLWRVVLCLSETYSGDDFTHIYAIDPIAGEGLDISVNLNLSVDEIREASRGEHWDRDIHLEAVANVFDTVREFDFDQALGRVSESVAKAAYARAGVSEDDILSDDKRREIAMYAAEGMIPFIVHNLSGIDISALERARRA